jgi:hypothetical protein
MENRDPLSIGDLAQQLRQVAQVYASSAELLRAMADRPIGVDALARGIASTARAGAQGASVLAILLEQLEPLLVNRH